ncbi:unnamed protein product [Clavelina lepadiformis]|uniref:Uncharacterized protein n=1 Tax=Clavelina lepadiformis TaxID=159417 RepID=A0ABP0GVK3_CLALP
MFTAAYNIAVAYCLAITSLLFITKALGSNFEHIQTFIGSVEAENFTYLTLPLEGHVVIMLESHEGDADLYLSSDTLYPTWDNYEMKSDSCSNDIVSIRKDQKRPIGVGVYGYFKHPISKFRLIVYLDSSKDNYYPEEETEDSVKFVHPNSKSNSASDEPENKESMLWTIFIEFLSIVLDILI